jgi:cell division protein FtsL
MSGRGLMLLTVLVTLVVSLFYVRSRFLIVELSYGVSRKQEEKTKLEQDRRSLTLELATLRNPKRVERIASQKFGLERPSDVKSSVFVREDRREVP